ncbi:MULTISPECIES: M67 family metallopeptidase [Prochlorococcus]|uniref:Predicted metal-dependent protease of the PAD1/JAB1 superfamily n=1 Tax=Prochlorococcus marinus (strain SARG / CCMP1375 / SS120) TaxID=167539 RepID=Q7V9V1_PROMA|nr:MULTISPECIES: M67 family metallopeptidase [Prochlorococcus]AAQ00767.1 Predicted metal-dependent protease of the PAD1/JAB1 superfamily [Prochlorococcus marinus subsp. marinus str. CCMP1375]KGG10738.1 Metal-dependent protease of the PAD1/JAB1 [Prochlorococcus marinus str. LG]KGG21160.1 Metal-dependent protease of the PAD1/JAB1 [Prochlorococcus marinus str. SS2]KGG23984.1 Metal-dependent protease of the PAD1/JAB1 [Prochlorococcus marinus str. SS35]KGG31756.1 Metal-dependent protease of the PAD
MNNPSHVELHKDSERILSSSLLTVKPEEGCALLLGKSIKAENLEGRNIFQIELVWPCCNIWSNSINADSERCYELNKTTLFKEGSRENRFLIDPIEQLLAQKWGRSKNLTVLGAAHSHPMGSTFPSQMDLSMNFSPNLMIIVNGNQKMRAWWLKSSYMIDSLEIPVVRKSGNHVF